MSVTRKTQKKICKLQLKLYFVSRITTPVDCYKPLAQWLSPCILKQNISFKHYHSKPISDSLSVQESCVAKIAAHVLGWRKRDYNGFNWDKVNKFNGNYDSSKERARKFWKAQFETKVSRKKPSKKDLFVIPKLICSRWHYRWDAGEDCGKNNHSPGQSVACRYVDGNRKPSKLSNLHVEYTSEWLGSM